MKAIYSIGIITIIIVFAIGLCISIPLNQKLNDKKVAFHSTETISAEETNQQLTIESIPTLTPSNTPPLTCDFFLTDTAYLYDTPGGNLITRIESGEKISIIGQEDLTFLKIEFQDLIGWIEKPDVVNQTSCQLLPEVENIDLSEIYAIDKQNIIIEDSFNNRIENWHNLQDKASTILSNSTGNYLSLGNLSYVMNSKLQNFDNRSLLMNFSIAANQLETNPHIKLLFRNNGNKFQILVNDDCTIEVDGFSKIAFGENNDQCTLLQNHSIYISFLGNHTIQIGFNNETKELNLGDSYDSISESELIIQAINVNELIINYFLFFENMER